MKLIISGGGTGGHIFPALSIAAKVKQKDPSADILFVGAEGRMEMEKVPAAGYPIIGLNVAGLQRHSILKNLALPFKLAQSFFKARRILNQFRPDAVVGVGGYASGPVLWCASRKGIPCLIQEQNSFAGLTNKLLGKKVDCICVAYEGMERFFPQDKLVFTGNPIREGIAPADDATRNEGIRFYGLNPQRRHILVLGGSLGSRTLNESLMGWIEQGCKGGEDVDILWQCGKYYLTEVEGFMRQHKNPCIHHTDFISRMDLAYAAADIVISRSGASSISELCVCRKATIFVPSPNVAEDHQTFNAKSLVNKGAAMMVKDADAREQLMPKAIKLVHDRQVMKAMEKNMEPLGITDAADRIVEQIYKIAK